jgi:hypothetical protein
VYRDRDRDRDRARPVIVREQPVVTVYAPPVYVGTYSTGYTYRPDVPILGATSLDGGQLDVDITGQLAGRSSLELEAVGSGSTYVGQVVLSFAGGGYQVVPVNQILDANNPCVRVAVGNGADITRVAIAGHSDWGGAIAVAAI